MFKIGDIITMPHSAVFCGDIFEIIDIPNNGSVYQYCKIKCIKSSSLYFIGHTIFWEINSISNNHSLAVHVQLNKMNKIGHPITNIFK